MDKNKAKEASDLLSRIKDYEYIIKSLNEKEFYNAHLTVHISGHICDSDCELDSEITFEIKELINKKIKSLNERLENL